MLRFAWDRPYQKSAGRSYAKRNSVRSTENLNTGEIRYKCTAVGALWEVQLAFGWQMPVPAWLGSNTGILFACPEFGVLTDWLPSSVYAAFYSLGFYTRAGPQYGNPVYTRCTRPSNSTTTSLNRSQERPTIYFITPTYTRPTQKVDLTAMCHTIMHIERVHWIIIEDSDHRSDLVTRLLQRCDVASTHLVTTRANVLNVFFSAYWRGLEQRNLGLNWLRAQCGASSTSHFTDSVLDSDRCGSGVVYFADDDNKYDLRLFEQVSWVGQCSYALRNCWWIGLFS